MDLKIWDFMLHLSCKQVNLVPKRQTPLEITGGVTLEFKSLTGQTLSNQVAQSCAPATEMLAGRQATEEISMCTDISQVSATWDFFLQASKMPRTERQKMFKIPRNNRFITEEDGGKPLEICQMDTAANKLIFTRVAVVSKQPFIAFIVRIEKEVLTP